MDQVRLGTASDMAQVMELVMSATEENAFVNPSPEKIATAVWGALTQQTGLVGIVDGPDEAGISIAKGIIILIVGENYYSTDKILEERIVYVHPEWRLSKYGFAKKLLRFAKEASDKIGLPLICGVISSKRTTGKVALYVREFGEPRGAFFLYNAPDSGEWQRD